MDNIATIVKNFFDSRDRGDLSEAKKYFMDMVLARNELAKSKGKTNYLTLQLNDFHKIQDEDFNNYLQNKSSFALRFNPKLNNIGGTPHFLSQIPQAKEISHQEILTQLGDPTIIDKIVFTTGETTASFKYNQDTESYTVSTPRNVNSNQKLAMTIHELVHVVTHELAKNQVTSIYESEKQALRLELEVTRQISPEFYEANIREYLMCFVNTDLQIDLFTGQVEDITSQYSKYILKYLGNPTNQFASSWTDNEKIVMKPLSDLPYAVALCNLLVK